MENKVTLIIADDEAFIRFGLEKIISDKQLPTEIVGKASNGVETLELITSLNPDIAIIDIKMPKLDGLQVMEKSKLLNCTTRFFILSGYSDFAFAQKALKFGAKEYFLKPLNIPQFIDSFKIQCELILKDKFDNIKLSDEKLDILIASSKTHFLNQILQNQGDNFDISNEKLNFLNLNIKNDNCRIIVFSLESNIKNENINLNSIITTIINYKFDIPQFETWLYNKTQIVCLANCTTKDKNLILQKIYDCLEYSKTELDLQLIVGLGDNVPDLSSCYLSYQSAIQSIAYNIYDTNTYVYDSSIICNDLSIDNSNNINSAILANAIIVNDINEIKSFCTQFYNSLFFTKMPPPNYIRGRCMYLVTNVQKEISLQRDIQDKVLYFSFEDLYSLVYIDDLKDWLIDIFSNYSNELNTNLSYHDEIIRIAKEYIRNNIDKNIKAKDIAKEVNLSESYFTVYFKNYSGENFRNYILNEKMNYAKNMISKKKYSISQIALAVGYENYRSFSRAFKNSIGLSPSEYLNSL